MLQMGPATACSSATTKTTYNAPSKQGATKEGDDRQTDSAWPGQIYRVLKDAGVAQASYVPDAGHTKLIQLLHADPGIATTVLTTEEEGVALSAGAWLGGQRSVLLLQSSGVGNCINMLSLMATCRFPLLAIVTMRGEWAEFNPWQMPMGRATPGALELMGVKVMRVDEAEQAAETVTSAATLAFDSDQRVVERPRPPSGGDRARLLQLRCLCRRRPRGEFLSLGCHGGCCCDGSGIGAGAAQAAGLRADRRRRAAHGPGGACHHRGQEARQPQHRGIGQRPFRRDGHADQP